jgi:chemotaxis protein histidine kinase CheA
MLNGTEWQHIHPQFFDESQQLLSTCQECLAHLEMISDDKDAVECLLRTLFKLSETADQALIPCTADFARQLRNMLSIAYPAISLTDDALQTLEHCLTLLAWQLELIDPRTGQLLLDDSEQKELLDQLAYTCGLEISGASPEQPPSQSSGEPRHSQSDAAT